jgi:hypothetical protein
LLLLLLLLQLVVQQWQQPLDDLLLPGDVQQEACMAQLRVEHHHSICALLQPSLHLQQQAGPTGDSQP